MWENPCPTGWEAAVKKPRLQVRGQDPVPAKVEPHSVERQGSPS